MLMYNQLDKKELVILSIELVISLIISFIYTKLVQRLSIAEFFILAFAVLAAVHGMTSYVFKFPYFRQYSEDSKKNIKKNSQLRLFGMFMGAVIVFIVLMILQKRINGG